MAVLRVVRGSVPGQVVELSGDRMVLGRHPSCQVVLDNAAVSRTHAQILQNLGEYAIEDLHSRNATFVNGQKIREKTRLNDGDEIRVCDVVMTFHLSLPAIGPVSANDTSKPSGRPAGLLATVTGEMLVPTASSADVLVEDNSSIISAIDVSPMPGGIPRVEVRPEVKLRAMMAMTRAMGGSLDLTKLLGNFIKGLFNIFPHADRGCVVMKDEESGRIGIRTMQTRRDEIDGRGRVSMTIIRQAMNTRRAILSADAVDDRRFEISESLPNLQLRSVVCAPLVGHDNQVYGVIQLDTLDVRQQFVQDDLDVLASVATLATLAVENSLLHQSALKQQAMQREIDFAQQVQMGFLPTERPKLPNYEFFDFYEAALGVGGDFFDYVPLSGGRIALGLGDVAGKGVAAALLMARLYSAARFELLTRATPAEAMTGLNAQLASSGLGHRFVTLVFLVIDPTTHRATLVNAGHLFPLLRRADGSVTKLDYEASGLPLGITGDGVYQSWEFDFGVGDTVLLFTDGVTEASDDSNGMYGGKRLIEFLKAGPRDVEPLGEALVADVESFCRGKSQRDDICLICAKRTA
jgi:sigma-B regulation protein RsbU (phosphoserine phosphatase)